MCYYHFFSSRNLYQFEHIFLVICEEDIQTFLKKFKDSKYSPSQNEVITFLHNRSTVRYFKCHVDQYCELYKIVIMNCKDAEDYIQFLTSENASQQILIKERQQFCINFVKIIVPTLLQICNKFNESDNIIEETSKLMQKCIFSSKEFDCYLTDLFENRTCSEKHSLCKTLFKCLVSLDTTCNDFGIAFKLFLHSFSKASKNSSNNYKMFIIFTQIIGFELRNEFKFSNIKYQIREPSLLESLNVLNQLLDVETKLNIDLECKINDVTFSHFLKNLILSVIALTKTPNMYNYQIFLKIIEISPLIAESITCEILTHVMLNDNNTYKRDYEEFMIKIFEIFNKLHRLQNLIAKMIPTLKSGFVKSHMNETIYPFRGSIELNVLTKISLDADNILSRPVLNYFTNCIVHLASWQVINLFKTLLHHLNEAMDGLLETKEETVYIQILSNILCSVLLGTRLVRHTVTSSAVVKFATILEELKGILKKFGTTILQKEHNHVLMRAFLNMSYIWGEVYMALEYYPDNSEPKIKKNEDANVSSCNLTFLHPYLSDKEWCLISERINNFGEKPCKEILQKLVIQKMKAFFIFENGISNIEHIIKPIIRTLSSDFDPDLVDIYTDEFVINKILCKMPFPNILILTEHILESVLDGNTEMLNKPEIRYSRLIRNGLLSVIFQKIDKLLKQKRKHDDGTVQKAICSRVMSVLPPHMFLSANIEELLPTFSEILNSKHNEHVFDFKIQEHKIDVYLEILSKLPIYLCSENEQKLLVLLLVSLYMDINESNCKYIKEKCESLIINITQQSKWNFLDIFDATFLLKIMVEYFDKYEDFFFHITLNVFKNDAGASKFEPIITYIKKNLKKEKCLNFAIIVINVLNRTKKTKNSTEVKEIISKYKRDICRKMAISILRSDTEDRFIEPYALLLKTYSAKDEDETLKKLRALLKNYVDYCFAVLSDVNVKKIILLFNTILQNKILRDDVTQDPIIKLWNVLKKVTIKNDILEDYSQLVMLITTLIPNEQFSTICDDLSSFTEKSFTSEDDKELSIRLKTWSFILSTNFNVVKTNILREQLGHLLNKLVFELKFRDYKKVLFDEITLLEISIVQANHIALTTASMDFLLATIPILLVKQPQDCCHGLDLSITLLNNLLKHRNSVIMDRLPPFLLQCRLVLKDLCLKSNSNSNFQQSQIAEITDCAHKMEKLTSSLVECAKDMSRIAMFLISDILQQYQLHTMHPNIKRHFNNCIYNLMSLCDNHAVQHLMRILNNASTEMFKLLHENYRKHRFTGKI